MDLYWSILEGEFSSIHPLHLAVESESMSRLFWNGIILFYGWKNIKIFFVMGGKNSKQKTAGGIVVGVVLALGFAYAFRRTKSEPNNEQQKSQSNSAESA